MSRASPYTVEFYVDAAGQSPVTRWLTEELTSAQRRAVAAALRELVAEMGQDICKTDFGDNIGEGLIELRLRQPADQVLRRMGRPVTDPHPEDHAEAILLRVFLHPHGRKQILVLHGYDKQANASARHQQKQIALARKRFADWEARFRAASRTSKPSGRR